MASEKPSIPKGTRDFSPLEMSKRNYIFSTIRSQFELFGFRQIETPAMETLKTLLGKYGEEGDKLLFKVLNSGDFLKQVDEKELHCKDSLQLSSKISEKGLRYDLTVPFARYVVMHREELQLPFKRYQIQPVWRADRPQKGRYREFYQCDADIVGSSSLLNEVELIQIIDSTFKSLQIPVKIKINNRKILAGLAEYIDEKDKIVDITVAIDKLDKIGQEGVEEELNKKGISIEKIALLNPLMKLSGDNSEKISSLEKLLVSSEVGQKGLEEIKEILSLLDSTQLNSEVEFNITLARGLNYYTGAIFEVQALGVQMGSISGGGRYDNLTGIFGLPGLSGVGISFGADRIYDVMETLDLFPKEALKGTLLMFVNFGEKETKYLMPIASKARSEGIPTEIYPDNAKIKKQMSYANNKAIRYVAILGEDEINLGKITLKDMLSGEQAMLKIDELILRLKNSI